MKYYIYLLVFFTIFISCKKEKFEIKKGKIEVNEKYIKYSSDKFNRQYIIISEDNAEVYDFERILDSSYNLPYGNYKLIYSSFYRKENEIKFIVKDKLTVVEFYPDSLDYTQIENTKCCLIVDRLKQTEILEFYINNSGCFFGFQMKIEIYKIGLDYYINSDRHKNKKLSTEQLKLLREFELEIHNLDLSEFYCTTTENYLFLNSTTNEFLSKKNGSCWYYGFSYFINSLKE